MEFRWLDGQEAVEALDPVIRANGWTPLNAETTRAVAAYEGDELVGFFVLQVHPLLGPLWVRPDYRNGVLSEELAESMDKFLTDVDARGFLAICDNPRAAHMCVRRGMKRVESPVYLAVGG